MTNQEAIKWLREAEILDLASGNTKDREAVNKAISALQALDEIYAFIMRSEASETTDGVLEIFDALQAQEAKHSTELSETQKALDTISRQAAIDAMAELQGRASTKAELKGISKAWKRIKQLPSAQHEREYTMEEFMFGQDMGNPEDGSL